MWPAGTWCVKLRRVPTRNMGLSMRGYAILLLAAGVLISGVIQVFITREALPNLHANATQAAPPHGVLFT